MNDQGSDKRRKIRQVPSISGFFEHGKVPPQAVDMEEAVLGAAMLEHKGMIAIADKLIPEVFYKEAHQLIYQAMMDLFIDNEPIDILTVTNKLKNKGELELVGGAYYISEITSRVSTSANIEYHSRVILQKYASREAIRISSEITRESFEDTSDIFEILQDAMKRFSKLYNGFLAQGVVHVSETVKQVGEKMDAVREGKLSMMGIPSTIAKMDAVLLGFVDTNLYILAGRPGTGKTAYMLTLIKNIAVDQKIPVGVFSLEMGSDQLTMRLLSTLSHIPYQNLQKADYVIQDEERLKNAQRVLKSSPIFIDDTAGINYVEMKAKVFEMVQDHGVKMIFVDYLQLMRVPENRNKNRENEVSEISRNLKAIAKEVDIPVFALAQLSRAVEMRKNKRPQLSDLRESGSIEQDSDVVLMLYRPHYHKITALEEDVGTDEVRKTQISEDYTETLIEKNRHGPLGKVLVRFNKDTISFTDSEANFDDMVMDVRIESKDEDKARVERREDIPDVPF